MASGNFSEKCITVKPSILEYLSASLRYELGPNILSKLLYCEIAPHIAILAPVFRLLRTSFKISPPTLSKNTSILSLAILSNSSLTFWFL